MYKRQEYDNFTPDISLGFEPESASEKRYTQQYLSLVKKTDEAFEMLIDYFSGEEEKTCLLYTSWRHQKRPLRHLGSVLWIWI